MSTPTMNRTGADGNFWKRLLYTLASCMVLFFGVIQEGNGGGAISVSAYNMDSPAANSTADYITMRDGSEYYRISDYAFSEPLGIECGTITRTSTTTSTLGSSINHRDRAIDNDLSTFSDFSPPLVSLGATMSQTVNLSRPSNPGDAATVTFSLPGKVLELNLLSGLSLQTFNGNTQVSSDSINSLLSLDLLGLLASGNKYTISHVPTGTFDRIVFRYHTGLLLSGNVHLYDVNLTPAPPNTPTTYPSIIEVCEGESATFTASSTDGSIIRWYDDATGGLLLQESTENSDAYITGPLPFTSASDTKFYYVSSAWGSGCVSESQRTPIAVVIKPKPTITPINGLEEICQNESTTYSTETSGGTWSSFNETIATVHPTSGLIHGVTRGSTIITYTITDPLTGCSSSVEKEVTIIPQPGRPNVVINSPLN